MPTPLTSDPLPELEADCVRATREPLMLPRVLAFQGPSSEGRDENDNFEFVAEVGGHSAAGKRQSQVHPHSPGRQRRGQGLSLPVWLG